MSAADRAIGIFDSGLGGLTALREIRRLLPEEQLVYFGDTGRVPYGTRSHETICRYAEQDMRFLLSEAEIKAVVIACGTVSANALPLLQEKFPVPVIGVIDPAVNAAAKATRNQKIGVIATPSTIASGAYEAGLLEKNPGFRVTGTACPLFVPLVENGFVDPEDPIPCLTAERYLAGIRDFGADTLILGCTHYPLLRDVIAKVLPRVTLIDTGVCVAEALCALLTETHLLRKSAGSGSVRYYVSDEPHGFMQSAARFLGQAEAVHRDLASVRRVEIDRF